MLSGLLVVLFPARDLTGQNPAALPDDVLQLVDAQAQYRPTPLPPDDNGFQVLVELQKLPVNESSKTEDRELDDAFMAVIQGERAFPNGELGERLLKLVSDNEDSLRLFDRFTRHRGVRFPDITKAPVDQLRPLMRIRRLQIAWLQSQHKHDDATRMLFEHLHVAEMLQDSEGGLVAWLTGYGMQANVLESFGQLAAAPDCPVKQIEAWQLRVSKLRSRTIESLAQSLRREYRDIELPLYSQWPIDVSLKQAVASTVGRLRPKPEKVWENIRFNLRELEVVTLLARHPRPIDRDETIRLSSQRVAELIRVFGRDRSRPVVFDDTEINRAQEDWPAAMSLDVLSLFPLHFGGPHWDSWEDLWNELTSITKAGERLSETPNVFGKYLIALHQDSDKANSLAGAVVRRSTRVEATFAVLAIRRFEKLQQRLPTSLQEVVDAKLLTDLPRDPIDGQPLRYDHARKLVWSIGLDGQDDGGIPRRVSSEKLFSMMRNLFPKNLREKLPKLAESSDEPIQEASDLVYSLDATERFAANQ